VAAGEAEIIGRILAGEKNLFKDLIRPYERRVYLAAFSILRNEAEAEDATQETMLNAYRYLGSFRAESKFSTWLVTIAVNESRQRLRKERRAPVNSTEGSVEEREGDYTPALLIDWREVPLEALERAEVREKIKTAVAELPGIYREVFTLRDLEEMDVQETAQALGITPVLVKVRLHRARILLQKALAPYLKRIDSPGRSFLERVLPFTARRGRTA
jgi:RNA polymerase sigma-70 factor, ECF subfamily